MVIDNLEKFMYHLSDVSLSILVKSLHFRECVAPIMAIQVLMEAIWNLQGHEHLRLDRKEIEDQ